MSEAGRNPFRDKGIGGDMTTGALPKDLESLARQIPGENKLDTPTLF